jgi:hypothetical protein
MGKTIQVHIDFQSLIDSLLSFAKSMVSEHGSFNPFGAVMYVDGQIQWVAADTGEEFPASQVLIDSMVAMFKESAEAGEICAAAICYGGRAIPPGAASKMDVISFILEHRSADSIGTYIPYVRKENGDVEYSEMYAVERAPQFFLNASIPGGS